MIDITGKEVCYMILETVRNEHGYIPCIAVENEPGYYMTDWNWGNDLKLVQECAIDKNEAMGIDIMKGLKIVASTMKF